ncbi:hypothetical protein B0O80DRAFT_471091 [Mortierella sp. GBAus27b]|jgi:hypothetical protein|nr:hypothetical protein B0O80DRAFT_471091 [Mortierella sp. GBAus27b]
MVSPMVTGAPLPLFSSTTQPSPIDVLTAFQIVINSLNDSIPAEAALLKPLFDMERRLRDKIHPLTDEHGRLGRS